ncbi:MAG: LCP family protein [Anaerolineae bacterium]|nr:LCP family protein [Anaerolineae bacterium]
MRLPGWMFILGIVALIAATAVCSVFSFNFARKAAVDLGESGVAVSGIGFTEFLRAQPTATPSPSPMPPTDTPRPEDTPVPTSPAPTATVDPLAQYTWQDPRRMNILLLGIDQRKGETGTFNTDTIMVFSVDPVRKSIGMLSIPRDLWVDIPGSQPSRINTAYAVGEINAYPGGGGPALTAATIAQNLGIKIDKYVLINFDVFTTVVDLIAPNGVEVCPAEEIDDPTYPDAGYGIIHVHFDPGCQRLNGEHLLQYARTRHTQNSDFDRALRQQEVIKAVRNDVLNAGGIANFIGQVPALWDELSGSYKTNLTLPEILSLATLAQQIPAENIHSGQIGPAQTSPSTAMLNGIASDVLTLDHTALDSLLRQVFNPPEDLSQAELRTRSEAESATIVVFNNTDIQGLAGQTRDWLASRQVSVAELGNMPSASGAPTTIRDYGNKPYTARYLALLLGLPIDRVVSGSSSDGLTTADVMVVVGSDLQPLLSGQ